jgi:ketosteroid isomerase-like protein
MRFFHLLRLTMIAGAVASIALVAPASNAVESADSAIRDATMRYYVALNSLYAGDVNPMDKIWSHSGEVSLFDFDGGKSVGWNDVHGSFVATARANQGRRLTPRDIATVSSGEMAYAYLVESGLERDPRGGTRPVSARVTMIFRNQGGNWKLLHRHVDTLGSGGETPTAR